MSSNTAPHTIEVLKDILILQPMVTPACLSRIMDPS